MHHLNPSAPAFQTLSCRPASALCLRRQSCTLLAATRLLSRQPTNLDGLHLMRFGEPLGVSGSIQRAVVDDIGVGCEVLVSTSRKDRGGDCGLGQG